MHLPCVAISVSHGTYDLVEKMFLDTGISCRIRGEAATRILMAPTGSFELREDLFVGTTNCPL